MKKSLAFLLIIALIFGSFSLSFAESTADAVLHVTEFDQELPETTVQYKGENWHGVPCYDYDFIIIKQASDEIYVWTPGDLSNKEQFWDRIIELSIAGKGDKSFLRGNDNNNGNGKGKGSEAETKVQWTEVTFVSGSDTINDEKGNPIYHFNVMATIEAVGEEGEIINEDFGPAVIAKADKVGHFDGGYYHFGEDVTIELSKTIEATGTAVKGTVDLTFEAEGIGASVILDNDTFNVNNYKFDGESTEKEYDDWEIRVNKLPCELKIKESKGGVNGIAGYASQQWTNDDAVYYVEFDSDGNAKYYSDEQKTALVGTAEFTNKVLTSRLYDIPYSITKTVNLAEKGSASIDNTFEFSVTLTDKDKNVVSSIIEELSFKNPATKTINGEFEKIDEARFPCTLTVQEITGGGAAAGWADDENTYSMVYDITGVAGNDAEHIGDIIMNNDEETTADAIEFINTYDNTAPKYSIEVNFTGTINAVSDAAFKGGQNLEFKIDVKDASGKEVDQTVKTEKYSRPDSRIITYRSEKYLAAAFPMTVEITETAGGTSADGSQYWINDIGRKIILTAVLSGSSIEYFVAGGDALEFVNLYGDNTLITEPGEEDDGNIVDEPNTDDQGNQDTDPETDNSVIDDHQAVKGSEKANDMPELADIDGLNIPLAEQTEMSISPGYVIPDAEMPKTGGLGTAIFLLLGGALTAAGLFTRRKKEA